MDIENPRYTNAENSLVAATVDGVDVENIPVNAANRHYAAILESGLTVAAFASPATTEADVVREREARLAAGFDYDFGDTRGIHRIGTTPEDLRGWSEVTDYARALLAANDTATGIAIVTDTGPCAVTADEWNAVLIAAAAFRQPIWAMSFALQASPPEDVTDDSHWST